MAFDEVVEMEHIPGDPTYADWIAERAKRQRALADPYPDTKKPGHSSVSDRASVA